jgi:hypothetical protein
VNIVPDGILPPFKSTFMSTLNRRAFISKAAIGWGGALALSHLPELLRANETMKNIPIGFQSWSVKDTLGKDFTGTLKTMSGMGYKLVEMCSPAGYATLGFGPLANIKPADLRRMITDAGLSCPSCHFVFPELTDHLDERIEW